MGKIISHPCPHVVQYDGSTYNIALYILEHYTFGLCNRGLRRPVILAGGLIWTPPEATASTSKDSSESNLFGM